MGGAEDTEVRALEELARKLLTDSPPQLDMEGQMARKGCGGGRVHLSEGGVVGSTLARAPRADSDFPKEAALDAHPWLRMEPGLGREGPGERHLESPNGGGLAES